MAAASVGCRDLPPCENTDVRRVASLDGELEAVAFERDCWASPTATFNVSVLPTGAALPDKGGNTFAAGWPEDKGSIMNAPLIGWRGDSVHVFYVAPRDIYKQEPQVAGRPVYYEVGDGFDVVL
jgi:hypothetical protein